MRQHPTQLGSPRLPMAFSGYTLAFRPWPRQVTALFSEGGQAKKAPLQIKKTQKAKIGCQNQNRMRRSRNAGEWIGELTRAGAKREDGKTDISKDPEMHIINATGRGTRWESSGMVKWGWLGT